MLMLYIDFQNSYHFNELTLIEELVLVTKTYCILMKHIEPYEGHIYSNYALIITALYLGRNRSQRAV